MPYPVRIGLRFFTAGSGNRLVSFISLLAISGLVLGVALLIVVLSVMNGFDREMRTRILGVVPHLQIYETGGIDNWPELANRLLTRPGVVEVTPVTKIAGMLNFRGHVQAIELQGVSPQHPGAAFAAMAGESFGALNDDAVLLSQGVAGKLGVVTGDQLTLIVPRSGRGQLLSPALRVLRVAGTVDTHTTLDNALAVTTLATASALAGLPAGRVQAVQVRVEDIFAARSMGYALMRALPERYSFIDWLQTHGNLYQAIQMSRNLVGLLVFLIIAVAVFNVVAILVMTVVEKRPAIAILKTQGASNGEIIAIFMVQGALIGLLGSFLGAAIGSLGAVCIAGLVQGVEHLLGVKLLNLAVYPIDYVPADLRATDVLTVVLVALGLNFLATLYPAWQAARVRPAQVLRYE
ncbi:MAG: lipoprotein-releasing ABC transporter permease subunit [Porticoccaceae bacterium]